MAVQYFTPEGLDRLKKELHELKSKGRSDMAKQIAEAREKGDLSENAEYDAAKEAQGLMEMKISQLEGMLGDARILDKDQMDTSKVSVLCKVSVDNLTTKKEFIYMLVSEKEADLKSGRISVNSPIGRGLLGKKVGETAEITVPAGVLKFKIKHITF